MCENIIRDLCQCTNLKFFILRYFNVAGADPQLRSGQIDEKSNPNGAIKNIAGIFNEKKNILGMMPHPERMIDRYLSGEDGSVFFENLIRNLK